MKGARRPVLGALAAAVLAAAAAAGPAAAPLPGQEAGAVLLADTIRVGDVVPVAVAIVVQAPGRVALPDTLPLAGADAENAARLRQRTDTLEDGQVRVTGIYAVTPWRAGVVPLPALPVSVQGPDGEERSLTVPLPTLDVVSVLPAAAELLDPMPAKGVVGPSYPWWLLPLLLLAVLVIGAAAWRWVARRRRRGPTAVRPALPPRERALAAVEQARAAGHIERGEWKVFYSRVTEAVREYLEALEPGWGEDLTTTEVLARVQAEADPAGAAALGDLLRAADQVKFARHVPDAGVALASWEAARRWVETFDGPARPEPVEVAA